MKTEIFESYADFKNRPDKEVNGVSPKFAKSHPSYKKENETNMGCWNCSDCSRCYGCSDKKGERNNEISIPKIENIHQKVYEAASAPHALNMDAWHTCDTTHCRAGWVVTLAGKEGKELEGKTSTLFAAMQIYKESSPIRVSTPRFFDNNEVALANMKRCAQEESAAR